MTRFKDQRGFAIVEVALVIVIAGIIAFVAWRVIQANGDVQTAQNQVPQTSAPAISTVPAAASVSDLSKLETQLNSAAVDDTTSSELDKQTTF